MILLSDVVLTTKRAAAFLGRSVSTLQSGRANRGGVLRPPCYYNANGRNPYYIVFELVAFAEAHGIEVHWDAIPANMRLDPDTVASLIKARRPVVMGKKYYERKAQPPAAPVRPRRVTRNSYTLPAFPARPKPPGLE